MNIGTSRPPAVALVPARSGSTRLTDKNVRILAGHPMLAYTIAAARACGLFEAVVVSTDSAEYADIARHYGAEVPFLRPADYAADDSPDIDWVRHVLEGLAEDDRHYEIFSILRPTSPFRDAATIVAGMQAFLADPEADSLRAVHRASQHPGKMWWIEDGRLVPVVRGERKGVPWHSSPTQFLPEAWAQTASLEIAWTRCVTALGTIAGERIVAFHNPPPTGLDVNSPDDWHRAEALAAADPGLLPVVDVPAYQRATARPERDRSHG